MTHLKIEIEQEAEAFWLGIDAGIILAALNESPGPFLSFHFSKDNKKYVGQLLSQIDGWNYEITYIEEEEVFRLDCSRQVKEILIELSFLKLTSYVVAVTAAISAGLFLSNLGNANLLMAGVFFIMAMANGFLFFVIKDYINV